MLPKLLMALTILMTLKNVTEGSGDKNADDDPDDTDNRKAKQVLTKLGRWVDRPMKAF